MLTIARDLAWITVRCIAGVAAMCALAAVLSGCGVSCRFDLVKRQSVPFPLYGVDQVCTRPVCDSPARLPASATITGACQ